MNGNSMEIRHVSKDELDGLRHLFELFPYKAAQRVAQRLDQSRLNRFYMEQIRRAIGGGRPLWRAARASEIVALAGLADDPWHGAIYHMKMGKIAPWMNALEPEAGGPLLETVLQSARARGYEHLSVRLDGEDYASLHIFEAAGFRLIDVSLKFTHPLPIEAAVAAPPPDWTIRPATEADGAWMRELGARAHARNHFLNDPALPRERTRELWDAWVARCLDGLAYHIYAAADARGKERGFIIYLRNRGFAEAIGRNPLILDYVILDPEVRGGGIGPWIIRETLGRESSGSFDYCELRTSQHNHAAILCYEKLGFRICATDFVLHKKL